jgi:hypothetical protein
VRQVTSEPRTEIPTDFPFFLVLFCFSCVPQIPQVVFLGTDSQVYWLRLSDFIFESLHSPAFCLMERLRLFESRMRTSLYQDPWVPYSSKGCELGAADVRAGGTPPSEAFWQKHSQGCSESFALISQIVQRNWSLEAAVCSAACTNSFTQQGGLCPSRTTHLSDLLSQSCPCGQNAFGLLIYKAALVIKIQDKKLTTMHNMIV